MKKVESLNKFLYKSILVLLKAIPFIISIGYFINIISDNQSNLYAIIGYLLHTSILNWVFLYLASFVFQFCLLHRLPLYYIALNDILVVIDEYIGIPVNDDTLDYIHIVIALLFLIGIIYQLYVKYTSKRIKEDH